MRIEEVDYDTLDEAGLAAILDITNAVSREANPRFVDFALEEFRLLSSGPGRIRHRFVASDWKDKIVGVAEGSYADDGSNPSRLRSQISVDSNSRRSGVGTALLAQLVGLARRLGRSTIHGWHFDTIPAGAGFARAVGASEGLQFHDNVLRIEDLDLDLMAQWQEQGPARALGYRVQVIEGPWPSELLGDIAHLYFVLERDMPLAEGIEPREWTPELVASMQNHYQQGTESISALAFEDSTGKVVGLTQLLRRIADPTTWIVTTTMVDPAHRGKGLGKWVKAAANLEALERWPGGVYQETGNAFTNEPMLAINTEMGFEHELTTTDVELDPEVALEYLRSKGVQVGGEPDTSIGGP